MPGGVYFPDVDVAMFPVIPFPEIRDAIAASSPSRGRAESVFRPRSSVVWVNINQLPLQGCIVGLEQGVQTRLWVPEEHWCYTGVTRDVELNTVLGLNRLGG